MGVRNAVLQMGASVETGNLIILRMILAFSRELLSRFEVYFWELPNLSGLREFTSFLSKPESLSSTRLHMGGCQNYGPLLGTLNTRCHIIIGIQKRTIILTTTHMVGLCTQKHPPRRARCIAIGTTLKA